MRIKERKKMANTTYLWYYIESENVRIVEDNRICKHIRKSL